MREDKILDCSNPQTVMSERELEVPLSNFNFLNKENLMVDFSSIPKKQKNLFSYFLYWKETRSYKRALRTIVYIFYVELAIYEVWMQTSFEVINLIKTNWKAITSVSGQIPRMNLFEIWELTIMVIAGI